MSGKRVNTHNSARDYDMTSTDTNNDINDEFDDYESTIDFAKHLDSLEIIYETVHQNLLSDTILTHNTNSRLLECINKWEQIDANHDNYLKQFNNAIDINQNTVTDKLKRKQTDTHSNSKPNINRKKSIEKLKQNIDDQRNTRLLDDRKNTSKQEIKNRICDETAIKSDSEPHIVVEANDRSVNKPLCDTEPKLMPNITITNDNNGTNSCESKPENCSPKMRDRNERESGEIISDSDVEIIGIKLPPIKKKKAKTKSAFSVMKEHISNNKSDVNIVNKHKTKENKKYNEMAVKSNTNCDISKKQSSDPRQILCKEFSVKQKQQNFETNISNPQPNRLCASNCGTILKNQSNSRYCGERCIGLSVEKALLMLSIAEQNSERIDKTVDNKRIAVVEKQNGVLVGIEYIDEKRVFRYIIEHPNYEVFVPDYVKNRCDNFAQLKSDNRLENKKVLSVDKYREKVSEKCAKKPVENNQKKELKKPVESKCAKRTHVENSRISSTDSIFSRKYSTDSKDSRRSSDDSKCDLNAKWRKNMKQLVKESEQQIRSNVKKSIVDILLSRCNEAKDICFEKRKIKSIAEDIEKRLFELYDRNTSDKYKNKYRSLMFNLKDTKNNQLFRQVVNGEISTKKLVKMSAEELASQELTKWREKEKNACLEIMTKEANYFYDKALSKPKEKSLDVNINANVDQSIGGFQIVVNASYLTSSIPDNNLEIPKSVPKTVNVQHEVVDKILEENAKHAINIAVTDELPMSHKPQTHVFVPQLLTLWQGVIAHEATKFSVNANKLSGATVNYLQEELRDTLTVCGRVSPEIVYDYIREVMICPNNEITVVLLDWNIEEKHSYDAFFDYFYQRCRYAVGKSNSNLVKNFYIIPVPRNAYVPNVFMLFNKPGLSNKFLDYLRSTQSNVLVGIIVTNVILQSYTPPLHLQNEAQSLLPPLPQSLPHPFPQTHAANNTGDPRTLVKENYVAEPMDIDSDIEITATVVNTGNNNQNNKTNVTQSISSVKDPRLKHNIDTNQ